MPLDEPQLYARTAANIGTWPDGGGFHDALGVDHCGNLYLTDFYDQRLYRVRTDGSVETVLEFPEQVRYGHGLEWGSGIDGWDDHAIYLPQPYDENTVLEVVIGVPSRQG
jgi:hypothetical protein